MKLLQSIYTSCKKGLKGAPGFQTYAMSEGITDDERREIERLSLYVPPTNLPGQPGKEEIDAHFPVALRFFKLKSERFGICRSQYVGQDYSRRFGNYFSHTLLLENGFFPVYPVQACAAAPFRKSLSPDEQDSEAPPEPLPPLELDEQGQITAVFADQPVPESLSA